VAKLTGIVSRYVLKRDGWLKDGFIHFPGGCNALVDVRVVIGYKGGEEVQVCPIEYQYVALDDANYYFDVDRDVRRDDYVQVVINNHDSTWTHTISVILTWFASRPVEELRPKAERVLALGRD